MNSTIAAIAPALTHLPLIDDEAVEELICSRMSHAFDVPALKRLCREFGITPVPPLKAAMIKALRAEGLGLVPPTSIIDFSLLDKADDIDPHDVLSVDSVVKVGALHDGAYSAISVPSAIAALLGVTAGNLLKPQDLDNLRRALDEIIAAAAARVAADHGEQDHPPRNDLNRRLLEQERLEVQRLREEELQAERLRIAHERDALAQERNRLLRERQERLHSDLPRRVSDPIPTNPEHVLPRTVHFASHSISSPGAVTASGHAGGLAPPSYTSGVPPPIHGPLGSSHAALGAGVSSPGAVTASGHAGGLAPPSYTSGVPPPIHGPLGSSHAALGVSSPASSTTGLWATGAFVPTTAVVSPTASTTIPIPIPAFPWALNTPGLLPRCGLTLPTPDMFSNSCTPKWQAIRDSHGPQWHSLNQSTDLTFYRIRVHSVNLLENTFKFLQGGVPPNEFAEYIIAMCREAHRETLNAVHFPAFLTATTDPTLAALTKSNHKELKAIGAATNFPIGFFPAKPVAGKRDAAHLNGPSARTTDPDSLCSMHKNAYHTNANCHAQNEAKKQKQGGGASGASTSAGRG